ncbi:MAG: hypothetical protein IJJ85_02435 [Clostridia bacterium]|nr:hypothetical protein [Clostridia bacterium]
MTIDFSYSIDKWIEIIRIFFGYIIAFFKSIDINLFKEEETEPGEEMTTEGE